MAMLGQDLCALLAKMRVADFAALIAVQFRFELVKPGFDGVGQDHIEFVTEDWLIAKSNDSFVNVDKPQS
jgi:hypothetical protein